MDVVASKDLVIKRASIFGTQRKLRNEKTGRGIQGEKTIKSKREKERDKGNERKRGKKEEEKESKTEGDISDDEQCGEEKGASLHTVKPIAVKVMRAGSTLSSSSSSSPSATSKVHKASARANSTSDVMIKAAVDADAATTDVLGDGKAGKEGTEWEKSKGTGVDANTATDTHTQKTSSAKSKASKNKNRRSMSSALGPWDELQQAAASPSLSPSSLSVSSSSSEKAAAPAPSSPSALALASTGSLRTEHTGRKVKTINDEVQFDNTLFVSPVSAVTPSAEKGKKEKEAKPPAKTQTKKKKTKTKKRVTIQVQPSREEAAPAKPAKKTFKRIKSKVREAKLKKKKAEVDLLARPRDSLTIAQRLQRLWQELKMKPMAMLRMLEKYRTLEHMPDLKAVLMVHEHLSDLITEREKELKNLRVLEVRYANPRRYFQLSSQQSILETKERQRAQAKLFFITKQIAECIAGLKHRYDDDLRYNGGLYTRKVCCWTRQSRLRPFFDVLFVGCQS